MSTDHSTALPKLAAPARRALAGAGYSTLEQLAQARESDIASLHGMGPNALKTLRLTLQEHDLSFHGEGDT
ncbi:helix-hairpin-helix domain-containing protein [Actinomadura napierensis]|uniref:DNA-binding protein n=1 Tax=Actinomadura napierensis TaxID=267854 RepID=A0ABN3ACU0_9ACTN